MGKAHFSVLGFPVRVDTSAIFIAAFIGLRLGSDAVMVLSVFFFSILLHELGHALAFRKFGCSSFITIHGMGGTTASFNAQRLTDRQHIFVSLAGPLSQLLLLGLPAVAARYYYGPFGYLGFFLFYMIFVNVGWALVNLLPIYPLDGGQVLHRLLRDRNVKDPWRISQIVTVAVGVPLAYGAYQYGYPIGAFLIGYMVLRGVMSGPPGGGSNTIQDAASQARSNHRQHNVKGAGREVVLAEAYDCLINGNANRLETLVEQLEKGRHQEDMSTLKAWEFVLYGSSAGSADQPVSPSVLLHATRLTISGTPSSTSGIAPVLEQSIQSPELLPAIVVLAKYAKLEEALAAMNDAGVASIRDALVKGGLPQEQMAVSRILRLRREAATES